MQALNEAGLKIIKEFEGCAFTAYQDLAKVWTIGWGSTRGVKPGMTIDQAEADRRLAADLEDTIVRVDRQVKVPLNENQFSALVTFTFNEGEGHLEESTLLKLLNDGQYAAAALQFPRWMKIRGTPSAGLLRRRLAERDLFLTPPN